MGWELDWSYEGMRHAPITFERFDELFRAFGERKSLKRQEFYPFPPYLTGPHFADLLPHQLKTVFAALRDFCDYLGLASWVAQMEWAPWQGYLDPTYLDGNWDGMPVDWDGGFLARPGYSRERYIPFRPLSWERIAEILAAQDVAEGIPPRSMPPISAAQVVQARNTSLEVVREWLRWYHDAANLMRIVYGSLGAIIQHERGGARQTWAGAVTEWESDSWREEGDGRLLAGQATYYADEHEGVVYYEWYGIVRYYYDVYLGDFPEWADPESTDYREDLYCAMVGPTPIGYPDQNRLGGFITEHPSMVADDTVYLLDSAFGSSPKIATIGNKTIAPFTNPKTDGNQRFQYNYVSIPLPGGDPPYKKKYLFIPRVRDFAVAGGFKYVD